MLTPCELKRVPSHTDEIIGQFVLIIGVPFTNLSVSLESRQGLGMLDRLTGVTAGGFKGKAGVK